MACGPSTVRTFQVYTAPRSGGGLPPGLKQGLTHRVPLEVSRSKSFVCCRISDAPPGIKTTCCSSFSG